MTFLAVAFGEDFFPALAACTHQPLASGCCFSNRHEVTVRQPGRESEELESESELQLEEMEEVFQKQQQRGG